MKKTLYTIEDMLELLSGLRDSSKMQTDSNDTHIMQSIARQVYKGIPLTDRQHNLCKQKLEKYKNQFTALDYDFDNAIHNLRMPLRQIDRSKTIEVVESLPVNAINKSKSKNGYIKIRFPFNKKDIAAIKKITDHLPRREYFHENKSHDHYIKFSSLNCYLTIFELQNRQFSTDPVVLDQAKKTGEIVQNAAEYQPSIVGKSTQHLPVNTVDALQSDIGDVDADTMIALDRRIKFSYTVPSNEIGTPKDLTEMIAGRTDQSVCVDPEWYNLNQIAEVLVDLQRLPLLVAIDEQNSFDQLTQTYTAFRDIVANQHQSVLFRVDGKDEHNRDLNNFIKDESLNNWVDSDTEIVYIKKNKLPKVLLKSDFVPRTVLTLTSIRLNMYVSSYTKFNCDLIVSHDKSPSIFGSMF